MHIKGGAQLWKKDWLTAGVERGAGDWELWWSQGSGTSQIEIGIAGLAGAAREDEVQLMPDGVGARPLRLEGE